MDSQALLEALEGSGGVVNTQYEARVAAHRREEGRSPALPCRKSVVVVTYVSSIPLENDRVSVQQRNDVEVWHTSALVSSAALDHLFFKFQQDRTGAVQKAVASEIGFPMEVDLVGHPGRGPQGAGARAGLAAHGGDGGPARAAPGRGAVPHPSRRLSPDGQERLFRRRCPMTPNPTARPFVVGALLS